MRLSVGMKIGGGFAIMLLFLLAATGMGVYTLNTVDADLGEVNERAERLTLDNEIEAEFQRVALAMRGYLLWANEADYVLWQEHMENTKRLLAARLDNCSAQARPKFEQVQARVEEYEALASTRVFPSIREGRVDEASAVTQSDLAPIIGEIETALAEYVQDNGDKQFELMAEVDAHTDASRVLSLAVSGGALLVGLLLAFFVTRSITGPVQIMERSIRQLAEGDFTQEIIVKARDEMGVLASHANQMRENLRKLIGNVTDTSQALAAHSEELAASTEEVSATIEEVAGTTNEVASVSQQGAENAEAAAGDAARVMEVAQRGNEAVGDTVERINGIAAVTQQANTAVQDLGTISKQIDEIINVITGIADQTNLLALNAAIEAARAGEQGRGFAVVAEEVRKLAEQSADAAQEIGALINKVQGGVDEAVAAMDRGVDEVKSGVEVAGTAGAALREIIEAVQHMLEVIRGVAEGSEQSNEGTLQLSAATQQITSSVQETTAAAGELAKMGEQLSEAVARFRV